MSDLAAENAKLKSRISVLEKELAEKTTTLEHIKKGAAALVAAIKSRHAQGLPVGKGEALKEVADEHGPAVAAVLEKHNIDSTPVKSRAIVQPSADDESPWLSSGPTLSQSNVEAGVKSAGESGPAVELGNLDGAAVDAVCQESSDNGLLPGICGEPKNNHHSRHPFNAGTSRSVASRSVAPSEDDSPWLSSGPTLLQSNVDAGVKSVGESGPAVEVETFSGSAEGTVCHEPSSNGKYPGICGYPKNDHSFRHTYKPGPIPTDAEYESGAE